MPTGVSRTSIKIQEATEREGGAAFSTPTKRYRVSRRLLVDDVLLVFLSDASSH